MVTQTFEEHFGVNDDWGSRTQVNKHRIQFAFPEDRDNLATLRLTCKPLDPIANFICLRQTSFVRANFDCDTLLKSTFHCGC